MDGLEFQSVFNNAVEAEQDFDTMFGGNEDDELIGLVLGEAADDEEEDFNTLDSEVTASDIDQGEESDNQPTCDSNGSYDIEKDNLGNLGCDKCGVEDGGQKGPAPDPEDIEGSAEKVCPDMDDIDESFIMGILGESECEGPECEDPAPDVTVPSGPVDLDDQLSDDNEEDAKAPEYNEEPAAEPEPASYGSAVVNDCGGSRRESEMDGAPDDKGSEPAPQDEEAEYDVDGEDEECEKKCDKHHDEDEECEKKHDDEDDNDEDDDEDDDDDVEDDDDAEIDESFISAIIGEASEDDDDEDEDEIIEDVEDDSELSDSEAEELAGEDDYDDEIIDSLLAED